MKHEAIRKAFERDIAAPIEKTHSVGRKPKGSPTVHEQGAGVNNKYLTYEQAKLFCAQAEYITSSTEYKQWIDIKGYKFLPKTPMYVYRKEWEGWNVYLGTGPAPVKKIFRLPYYEAKSIAQKLAIKYDLTDGDCFKNWITFFDSQYLLPDGESEIPRGLPRHPHSYYDEWEGWPAFLGKGLKNKIEQLQEKAKLALEVKDNKIAEYSGQAVYAITTGIDPMNSSLIKVIVNNDGLSQLIASCNSLNYDILGVYIFEQQQLPAILDNLNSYGKDKGDSCFQIRDLQGLMSGLAFDTEELSRDLY